MRFIARTSKDDAVQGATVVVGDRTSPLDDGSGSAVVLLSDGVHAYTVSAPGLRSASGSVTVQGSATEVQVWLFEDRNFDVTVRTWWASSFTVDIGAYSQTAVPPANLPFVNSLTMSVPSGRYDLSISSGLSAGHTMPIVVDADLEYSFGVAGIIVSTGDWNRAVGATVEMAGKTMVVTETTGASFILPQGNYHYTASLPGWRPAHGSMTLTRSAVNHSIQIYEDREYRLSFTTEPPVEGVLVHVGEFSGLTDANGSVELSVPSDTYTVSAYHPQWDMNPVEIVLTRDHLDHRLWLNAGAVPVTFNVTENGEPAAGVLVSFGAAQRRTDSNGAVSFSVRPNQAWTWGVFDDRYVTVTGDLMVTTDPPPPPQAINVERRRYHAEFNTYEGSFGQGAFSALITVVDQSGQSVISHTGFASFNLVDGTYTYTIEKPCFDPVTGTFVIDHAGTTVRNTLRHARYPIVFEATHRAGGLPADGAVIQLANNHGALLGLATTDANGIAQFNDIPGAYRFNVPLGRYLPMGGFLDVACAEKRMPITLAEAIEWPAVFSLTTFDDRPLSGVTIRVGGKVAVTDSGGTATLELLEDTYPIAFEGEQLLINPYNTLVSIPEGGTTITQPFHLREFPVTFSVDSPPSPVRLLWVEAGEPGTLDHTGGYTLNGGDVTVTLPPGTHPWEARLYDDFAPASGVITVADTGQSVVIPAVRNTYPVTITVVDRRRQFAVEGVSITLDGETRQTDATGSASFSRPVGAYAWQATHADYIPGSGMIDTAMSAGALTIGLEPMVHSVTVQVTDGTSPLEWARVNFNGTEHTTGPTGELQFPAYRGQYPLSVEASRRIPFATSVSVGSGDVVVPVSLAYQPYDVTILLVDRRSEAPLTDGEVEVNGVTHPVDGHGHATFQLITGTHAFTASAADHTPVSGSIEVIAGPVVRPVGLDPATHRVTLTVTDGAAPIANAEVTFVNETYPTDANGNVVFHAASGSYAWSVVPGRGFENGSGTVVVNAADVNLSISAAASPRYSAAFSVTSSGIPIDGAAISIDGTTLTTSNGEATAQLLPGSYEWRVSRDGYEDVSGTLSMTNAPASIPVALPPSAYDVTFTITDVDPASGVDVLVGGTTVTTDANGVATLRRISGSYTASLSSADHESASVPFTVSNAPQSIPATLTLTNDGLARVFHRRGATAAATMAALQSRDVDGATAVSLLVRHGFDAVSTGAALKEVYNPAPDVAAALLHAATVSPGDIVSILEGSFSQDLQQMLTLMHDAGISSIAATRPLARSNGITYANAASLLKTAGYDAADVIRALRDVIGVIDSNLPGYLQPAGFTATQIADGLRVATNATHLQAARSMRTQFATPALLGPALATAYSLGAHDLVEALWAPWPFRLAEILPVVRMTHGISDAAFLALSEPLKIPTGDMVLALLGAGASEDSIITSAYAAGVSLTDVFRALSAAAEGDLRAAWVQSALNSGFAQEDVIRTLFEVSLTAGGAASIAAGLDPVLVARHLRALGLSAAHAEYRLLGLGYSVASEHNVVRVLVSAGYPLREVIRPEERMNGLFAAHMRALGVSAESVGAYLTLRYGADASSAGIFARDMVAGGYPHHEAVDVIRAEIGLGPEECGVQLLGWWPIADALPAITQAFDLDVEGAIRVLVRMRREQTVEAATFLRTHFNLSAARLVEAYGHAGRPARDAALVANHAFGLSTAAELIPLMPPGLFPVTDAFLLFLPLDSVAQQWKSVGYSVEDFTRFLNRNGRVETYTLAYRLNLYAFPLHDVVAVMHAHGYPAAEAIEWLARYWPSADVNAEVASVYMLDPISAILAAMRARNDPVLSVIHRLEGLGVVDVSDQMMMLRDAGWPRADVVSALGWTVDGASNEERLVNLVGAIDDVYGGGNITTVGEALRALRLDSPKLAAYTLGNLLYPATDAAAILRTELQASAGDALTALSTSVYRASDWQGAINTEYGVDPLAVFAEQHGAAGASASQVLRAAGEKGLLRAAIETAAVLSALGFERAQVFDAVYTELHRDEEALMTIARDLYSEDSPAGMFAAFGQDRPPLAEALPALTVVLGTSLVEGLAAARVHGYSLDEIQRYLRDHSPRDDGLAATLRTYGLDESHAWNILLDRGYSKNESAAILKAQGYSPWQVASHELREGNDVAAVNMMLAVGYSRPEIWRAIQLDGERRGQHPRGTINRVMHAMYRTGDTTLAAQVNIVSFLVEDTAEVVMALVDGSAQLRQEMPGTFAGWSLRDIAVELAGDSRLSIADLRDGILAVPYYYTLSDKYDAIRAAVVARPLSVTRLINTTQDVIATTLSTLGPQNTIYQDVLAIFAVSHVLTAKELVTLLALRGYSWKVTMVLVACGGNSLSSVAAAVFDIYKPVILFEVLLAVFPAAVGANDLAQFATIAKTVANAVD